MERYLFYLFWTVAVFGCSLKGKITNGYDAYDRKQYSIAVEMLTQTYEKSNDNDARSSAAYYLGKSYEFLKDNDSAQYWYEQAVKLEYGVEAIRDLAYANKNTGNYKNAIAIFKKLDAALGGDRSVQREIFVIEQLEKWKEQDNVSLKLTSLNSGYADYSPVLFQDNYIVFTSDRQEATGTNTYKWTGNKFSDLFISPKNGSKVTPFDIAFLDNSNVGTIAFNKDFTEAIFTKCSNEDKSGDDYCQLYSSVFQEGVWSDARRLDFQSPDVNYGQPTFLAQDSVLVYSAYMDSGRGGHDLYYSERLMNVDSTYYWSESYAMPETINTLGNEMFPSGHGDTLYFSSDFHPGYGGLDIFMTVLKDFTWSAPVNMLKPFNSSADDFGLIWDESMDRSGIQRGYFSSSRDGLGNDDIYAFTIREKQEEETTPDEDTDVEEEIDYTVYLAVKVRRPVYKNDNPNESIESYQDLSGVMVSVKGSEDELFRNTDDNGRVILEINENDRYKIKGQKVGFFADEEGLSTYDLTYDDDHTVTVNVTLTLNPIYVDREIVLKNIYYDYDKWNIRDDARPALDSLSQILALNPGLKIELASHTDCRGEVDYNVILSQRRAQAAVDYIAEQGINGRRLLAKGYGKNVPAVNCICEECTEDQHQQNRRTTFKILR